MTLPTETTELLTLAVEAAQRAGQLINSARPKTITDKGDRDLTSDVDVAAEHTIRDLLYTKAPAIPMLGEESGGADPSTGLVWIVDPIDGTVNYLHGLPTYAVSISLVDNSRTALAVLHVPETKTTYTTIRSQGAQADGQPIHASRVTSLRDSLIAIDQLTFSSPNPAPANALRVTLLAHLAPLVGRIRIQGASVIDLAWTAQGKLDASIILANNPWDTSGGVLLAREAGAIATDLQGDPHHLNSTTTVVAAPGIADELHAAITEATTAHNPIDAAD